MVESYPQRPEDLASDLTRALRLARLLTALSVFIGTALGLAIVGVLSLL